MWRPLGVAVIGGLTVSTILTLILVPVLYCSFAGVGIRRTPPRWAKAPAGNWTTRPPVSHALSPAPH